MTTFDNPQKMNRSQMKFSCFVTSLICLGLGSHAFAQSSQQVAPTKPLPANEQQQKFHLPAGFEIQLIVDESFIGQPMNLNFDSSGRLWITHSVEYPYPVAGEHVQVRDERFGKPTTHTPRDRVTVVEGISDDGTPAKVWNFVTGLNIPIGVTPVDDGAIVYSIPNIEQITRTKSGTLTRKKLFGPFGNVDTHGMTNSFIRWIDGWIYACHGFRNDTTIAGTDGQTVHLNSGNIYRFREDGSHVEQFTWGQVNPFGLTFDPWGNLYSADCHSMPLTLLLRGAYYSSFGKPHDGLGYGPNMINHSHGSTGICGPAYYAAEQFPAEYRDNLFLCNPVTGRVHRDKLINSGSTRVVDSQPDFITCDDPWFRPVDAALGPDGALYIADFYNAVIGHYEVPLEHPSRDRTHGRVWRIVYKGDQKHAPVQPLPDLTSIPVDELVALLGHANLTVRMLATNTLLDRNASNAAALVLEELKHPTNPEFRAHAFWILARTGQLNSHSIQQSRDDESPLVRTHLARVLAEKEQWSAQDRSISVQLLNDQNAFVQRAAADAIGRHPAAETVAPLMELLQRVPAGDTHLQHMIRIALKSHLQVPEILSPLDINAISTAEKSELASILLAVPTQESAERLLDLIDFKQINGHLSALEHVINYGDKTTVESLTRSARQALKYDQATQFQVLKLIAAKAALTRSGLIRDWAVMLTKELLEQESENIQWTEISARPAWTTQSRVCADGMQSVFLSTLPLGESGTGVMRSGPFKLPEHLSFYLAGHCGFPDQACHGKNRVVLRDAQTRQILIEVQPPRNDTAQLITWEFSDAVGTTCYLELIDGDDAGAYAWFAVGRFSLPALNPVPESRSVNAEELVRLFQLKELNPELQSVLADTSASRGSRRMAAISLLALFPDPRLSALLLIAEMPSADEALRERVFGLIATRASAQIYETLGKAVNLLSNREQFAVIETLLSNQSGTESLLEQMETGKLSPRHLLNPSVKQKLLATKISNVQARIDALLKDLPAENEVIGERIRLASQQFSNGGASVEQGQLLFKKHCSVCHKIGTEGNIVGPQLDGIGRRGLERVLQDVLDPNQNVDGAFRQSTLALNDGRVLTGLLRRTEGDRLVFADQKGKEFTVAKEEIDVQKLSSLSLMPANLMEAFTPEELNHLVGYLLEQR